MTDTATTVEAPERGLPPDEGSSLWQRYGVAAMFLAPALVLLGVWIVYPTLSTIRRSFYDRNGDSFIGIDNYRTLFSDETLRKAIKNNLLWLLVVPAFVTAIGLVFAVLLERIRFSVAFKVAVFMPMAISLFAAGVIWRLMYEKDPAQGTVNASIAVVKDAVQPSGALPSALPVDRRRHGRHRSGHGARTRRSQHGRRRADRPDRDPRVGRAGRRPASGGARGALRRHHRRRLERLQARRRNARQGRGR